MSIFRGARMLFCLTAFVALIALVSPPLDAQIVEVINKGTVSTGWHPWYEIHADPENSNNLIICGAKWNARDNASYGFVYASSDGGVTWRQTLEDKRSTWVSEESCAYGLNGVAYFLASASKVIDGVAHHELGTTSIYLSNDSGRTWQFVTNTGWTDWSSSVVDTTAGPERNRLYVFFNDLDTFYTSIGDKKSAQAEIASGTGNRIGMISYRAGTDGVIGPFTSNAMGTGGFRGAYPAPAFLSKDGSLLAFFSSHRRSEGGRLEFLFGTIRTISGRKVLEFPRKVVSSLDGPGDASDFNCGPHHLISAGTYDSKDDALYFAYPDLRDGACHLFLTQSSDLGKSWSPPRPISTEEGAPARVFGYPGIVANGHSVLGMLWEEGFRTGCWSFAALTDGKDSLSQTTELGTCSDRSSKPSALSTSYLWTSFFQASSNRRSSMAKIRLRNARNNVWRNEHSIAVTADGTFHVAWIDGGADGQGQLCVASIRVSAPSYLISASTKGLTDITTDATFEYGGDQQYESGAATVTLLVAIKNNGSRPIQAPVKLVVSSVDDRSEFIEIANADNKSDGAGAVWDVSHYIPNGTLPPGATSKPFPLRFRYFVDSEHARDSDNILDLNLQVFAAQ